MTSPDHPNPDKRRLTKQQERAMRAFLWPSSPRGFDDHAGDLTVWSYGVRPWPTMDNLVAKGLVEAESWNGHEEGWNWQLTDLGRDYMRRLVENR
jgi:predicted ArsR family transcriptional regulator